MARTDQMLIMGVVNITPDSFSDGGDFFEPDYAINQSISVLEQGADIIDLGAESTRPGAAPVDPTEEWQRLVPVLRELTARGLGERISVDSRHDETILKAHAMGVRWFNNVAGLCETSTLRKLAQNPGTRYIAMHMHGEPRSMQTSPLAGGAAIAEVREAFHTYEAELLAAGFAKMQVFLDPGIGFGKSDEANLKLLAETAALSRDFQLAIGISRKSFIGRLLGIEEPRQRDAASKMLEFSLWNQGAALIRTHAVRPLAKIRATLRGEC